MKKEKKEKKIANPMTEIKLDIPKDEIWTYRIDGLAEPHINKPYTKYAMKKAIFVVTIIIAITLSMYFSIRAVHKKTFEYKDTGSGTYEFVKFSNTGYITELDIDFISHIEYNKEEADPEKNFTIVKDTAQPIVAIKEYAFNCDEKLEIVRIGADVSEIDGKSFYTCRSLKQIIVDENNKHFCDIDGVLYNKDKTEIICYPMNHAAYLREKYGYTEPVAADSPDYTKYVDEVLTYVIPSTVEKIGKLCFNNSWDIVNVYMPEGIKTIETLAFFKNYALNGVYSYTTDEVIEATDVTALEMMTDIYPSLPEGLEYIGSDAFSYNQGITYLYIPDSVTYIGHHAFWATVYESDGQLHGIAQVNTPLEKNEFDSIGKGGNWRPQYGGGFGKKISVNYSAERAEIEK